MTFMNNLRTALLATTLASLIGCANKQETVYYQKEVTFPENATQEQKIDIASRLVPTERQRQWQELELTAFMHFGINTFTGREWGDGTEDPALFNPANLDAEQWVSTLSNAGFKMVILTAKHHDGFCLWPTKTTSHSVASSPWRDGKGDVVADLRKACDKYGMKMGLYLSPWDRNADCYGDSQKYNDMFVEQLTELLTNYGHIDEVWFDGANGEGPNGRKQEYDWQRFRATMERLQPDAVLAITGDDVRWVGNEDGKGRETEWSATVLTPAIYPDSEAENEKLGISATAKDLGSRELVHKATKMYWWPSEVDVSIRPGWFFHADESPKSLAQLADIYLTSVGRNSVLLLNVPPDTEGLINRSDVIRLNEFKEWLTDSFSNNVLKEKEKGGEWYVNNDAVMNCVVVSEDITKGQRVEQFAVEGFINGEWKTLASGTTIGYKRILTFPDMKPEKIRINVKGSRGEANIKGVKAYHISIPQE